MGANVREEVERARADEMEAQRGARPNLSRSFLKKTRGSQTRNRIRHRLPPEYPAGHRKAQSRVTQMHEPHRYHQPSQICSSPQGRDQHHYRQNSSGIEGAQGTTVPLKWHGSNSLPATERLRGGLPLVPGACSSARPCFPLLRFGRGVELRRWKDCFLTSVSERLPDRHAASHPNGSATLWSGVSACRIEAARPPWAPSPHSSCPPHDT